MALFRKTLFWLHLTAGVVGGLVILVMCVTGTLLTFQQTVLGFIERDQRRVTVPDDGARLSADDLLARVREQLPDATVTAMTLDADPAQAVAVSAGPAAYYVDPYSGRVLGTGSARARAFYRSVTGWHRWLAQEGEARTTARAITGACNAVFLLLALTGLYLWIPRRWTWRHVAPVLWFRDGVRGKARDFNWHNVIGLWCAPVLIVLTTTGMVISYPWASTLVYTLTGSPLPAGRGGGPGGRGGPTVGERGGRGGGERGGNPGGERAGDPRGMPRAGREGTGGPRDLEAAHPDDAHRAAASVGAGASGRDNAGWQRTADPDDGGAQEPTVTPVRLETLLETARRRLPTWSTLSLRLPAEGSRAATVSLTDAAHWNRFARSTVTLDAISGAVIRWEPYAAASAGQKLRGWMRFAHTGELGGRPGELVAGLACVGGSVLVYTGLVLSLRRFAAWRGRRSKAVAMRVAGAQRSGATVVE